MPLALTGSLTAVQFCYPAELPLALNKIEHFSKVSLKACPGEKGWGSEKTGPGSG